MGHTFPATCIWLAIILFCSVLKVEDRATEYPGTEVIKLFSCSAQLSMKFSMLINIKMPTIVGILTSMRGENNILGLTEP